MPSTPSTNESPNSKAPSKSNSTTEEPLLEPLLKPLSQPLGPRKNPWPLTSLQKPAFHQPGVPKFLEEPAPDPDQIKVIFVAEAFGMQEKFEGRPLVGASGKLFHRFLKQACQIAGVSYTPEQYWYDNLINIQPTNNNFDLFCASKAEVGGKEYSLSPIDSGLYLRPEFLTHLAGLWERIEYFKPNLVVCLGARAMWAILRLRGIRQYRGTLTQGNHGSYNVKVLATYHPAALMRQWNMVPIFVHDLAKAMRESASPELRFPNRIVHIVENAGDIVDAFRDLESRRRISPAYRFAVDTETHGDTITCVGISKTPYTSYVFPFEDENNLNGCYWPDTFRGRIAERTALKHIISFLRDPRYHKVMQNGLYDLQYFLHCWKTPVINFSDDTMLLHHSMEPEMEKGLGWLGSIYCNAGPWKDMRPRGHKALKKEE